MELNFSRREELTEKSRRLLNFFLEKFQFEPELSNCFVLKRRKDAKNRGIQLNNR